MVKITNRRAGNCPCVNCGRTQEGLKMHPYSVYHKDADKKRGSYEPVCCIECAHEVVKKYK